VSDLAKIVRDVQMADTRCAVRYARRMLCHVLLRRRRSDATDDVVEACRRAHSLPGREMVDHLGLRRQASAGCSPGAAL
jgi:hypothetical protein